MTTLNSFSIASGNLAFRSCDYQNALDIYTTLSVENPFYEKILKPNIRLTRIKLGFNKIEKNYTTKPFRFSIIHTPHVLYIAMRLAREIERYGWSATLHSTMPTTFDDDWYFVLCPQMFTTLPPGEKRICYQLEQTVSSRWITDSYVDVLENSFAVLDYSLTNIEYFSSRRIVYPHVYYLPVGACEDTYKQAQRTDTPKDIDVLFYGDALSSERRRDLIDKIKRHYNVHVENDLFGSEMRNLIRRAKVVLNIHYYNDAILETPRIAECISNGVPVVSEKTEDR